MSHLVKKLRPSNLPSPLRVLDLCTGAGCIPLLFHHEYFSDTSHANNTLELVGVDISPEALSLARENLIHQIAQLASSPSVSSHQMKSIHSIGFVQADVLSEDGTNTADGSLSLSQALKRLSGNSSQLHFDILISNPPYVSPKSFQQTTSRSVKHYEPRIALVPPVSKESNDQVIGDLFYPKLLSIAEQVNAKLFLFEVSDLNQAKRVSALAAARNVWDKIEV